MNHSDAVTRLNGLSEADARDELRRCCGAGQWVAEVVGERPFADGAGLMAASEWAFAGLGREDWLEAFAHHPRIGDVDALRAKFSTLGATKAWAGNEQAGVRGAEEQVLHDLAEGNQRYEEKFGYLFIVCATGKSAREMLDLLNARLGNDPDTELSIAAEQQKQITRLRLQKLLAP